MQIAGNWQQIVPDFAGKIGLLVWTKAPKTGILGGYELMFWHYRDGQYHLLRCTVIGK
jgi:hypothetical protein